MTEEEYFRKNYPDSCYGDKPLSPHWDFFQDGVEFGERQSEKRIEELEATCNKWFEHLKNREEELLNELNNQNAKYNKQIAELKEQNTNLQEMLKTERSVTCKEEYLKKVTELEQENAELKVVERMALYSRMSDRLAKAEELLLELYDCIPSSMADSCKETLQKVALFFKDSEVEK